MAKLKLAKNIPRQIFLGKKGRKGRETTEKTGLTMGQPGKGGNCCQKNGRAWWLAFQVDQLA
jgi:hypothetical protein